VGQETRNMALDPVLVQSLSTLNPDSLKALSDAVLHLQQQDMRRSAEKADALEIDSGDTAFMLICTSLVLLMTIPGLALFYGGLSQAHNVLATVMHSFASTCIVTLAWALFGYTIAFDGGAGSNAVLGGPQYIWLGGQKVTGLVGTIPKSLYLTYQGTFAVITVAILTGSIAERVRFGPMLVFMSIWHLLVYCPLAHWEWGGGFMSSWGVLDFAGGDVVHISSGVSGLAASLIVGKRKMFGHGQELPPHNILLVFMGASLLWVGWFGFNAGSAMTAGRQACMTMLVTHIAACAGGFSWMMLEWILKGKPSVLGTVSGAIAGLVVATPGSGYMDHTGGLVSGLTAGPVCYFGIQLKHMLGYDDALDAFGVHGIGGIWGGIVTGLMANPEVAGAAGAFYGNPKQLGIQIAGILTTMVFSFIMTLVIIVPLDFMFKALTGKGVRCSEEAEDLGLDISEHGESMMPPRSGDSFDGAKGSNEPDIAMYNSTPIITTIQNGL
jgi:Amt family ammonium transporter